jgi:hypothetical protein
MSSCMVLDPLGAQAVRRPGHLLGRGGDDVFVKSTIYIFKFYLFLTLLCNFNSLLHAQDHFHLAEGISMKMANIIFDKAA